MTWSLFGFEIHKFEVAKRTSNKQNYFDIASEITRKKIQNKHD